MKPTDELLFYNWVKVIIYLYNHQNQNMNKNATLWNICKDLNIASTSSITQTIKIFEHHGLIKIERKGRTNKYTLTAKGVRVAEHLTKARAEL